MSVAVVPFDPRRITVAQVAEVATQVRAMRDACRAAQDADGALELLRRIRAFEHYVQDKTARQSLEREARLTEMLIGDLLGKAVNGRPANSGDDKPSKLEGLSYVERNRFRALAENRQHVEEMLDRGVTKRKAILDSIEAVAGAESQPVECKHGVYGAIVIDPPWRYGNTSTRGAAEDHYPTMTLDELERLPERCDGLAKSVDSHLYLWTTTSFLREAFALMDAWGYTYKTNLVWVKPQIGMGNYFRVSHEHVLFGIRGDSGSTLSNDISSWFQAPRERHSKKPDVFYDLVEASSPGPYLDVFARPRQQRLEGQQWDVWGNEYD